MTQAPKGLLGQSTHLEPLHSLSNQWEGDLETQLSDEIWQKASDRTQYPPRSVHDIQLSSSRSHIVFVGRK